MISLKANCSCDDEPFDYDDFLSRLNESHLGLDEVKKEIANCRYEVSLREGVGNDAMLFSGPAGVGKSSLAEAIANACNAKLVKIPLEGITHAWILTGTSNEEGLLAKRIAAAGLERKVLLLDEIDKTSEEVLNVLIELLDMSNQHRTVNDLYIGQINLDGVLIIATCNDTRKINPIIMNRFQYRFDIPDYSHFEKYQILKERIIPDYVDSLIKRKNEIKITDGAILQTIIEHQDESGIRVLKSAAENSILRKVAENRAAEDLITVDIDDVMIKR